MVLKFGSCGKAMAYKLKYHPDVKRSDLPKIDAKNMESRCEEPLKDTGN
jgi:hypothetical protein